MPTLEDAYYSWERRGKPLGDDWSDWFAAEKSTHPASIEGRFLRWRIGPVRTIAFSIAIVMVATIATLFIPGMIAYRGGVFYDDAKFLKHLPPEAQREITSFRDKETSARSELVSLDTEISRALQTGAIASNKNLAELLQMRAEVERQADLLHPPISVIPFYLNPQMLLWPAIYSSLALLIFIVPPYFSEKQPRKENILKSLALGILVYVAYEWPLWARTIFNTRGRTVYGYPNFDIDKGSFITQEIVVLGFCVMLGVLWTQWTGFFSQRSISDEAERSAKARIRHAFDVSAVNQISLLYTHWQFASLILAGGFFFFTRFFWSIVGDMNDQRYILSALNAHLLWGISWAIMTLPLVESWRRWNRVRLEAIRTLAVEEVKSAQDAKTTLDLLKEVQPVAWTNLVATQIAAGVAFFLPLARLFVR